MATRTNAEKAELSLGLNSFNQPAETSGVKAWVKLITNLLFMNRGSYPSDPNMGCELQEYQFSFIEDKKSEIESLITDQIRRYLPDIPFESVNVSTTTTDSGKVVLLIILQFIVNSNGDDTVVVAAEKSQNLINFEVVM